MNERTAYLIGVLDITKDPPELIRVEICSLKAGECTHDLKREFWFDVLQFRGRSFGEAKQKLVEYIQRDGYAPFSWVPKFLKL